jgi:hypothetical protein
MALTSLSGMEDLTSINEILDIRANDSLTNLAGLENLSSIKGCLYIGDNISLNSLAGLDGLISIDSGLSVDNNEALSTLTALTGLTFVGEKLWIAHNEDISLLTGLENIDEGSITDLSIYDNSSLSTCNVESICNYLASSNGTVEIHDNATGCNSREEVEASCGFGIHENSTSGNLFTIFPNPGLTQITIETSAINHQSQLSIFNMNGQKILTCRITKQQMPVDISGLSQGVYFVKVISDDSVMVEKFVKQ